MPEYGKRMVWKILKACKERRLSSFSPELSLGSAYRDVLDSFFLNLVFLLKTWLVIVYTWNGFLLTITSTSMIK